MLISQTSALCQGPDSHLLPEQGKKEAVAMRLPVKEVLTSHLYPQGVTGGSRQGPRHRCHLGDAVLPFFLLSHGCEGHGCRSMA